MKACSRCSVVKPLADYHRERSHSDGMASHCKECQRARDRERNSGPVRRDAGVARINEWREQNPEKVKSAKRLWRERNPVVYSAITKRARRKYWLRSEYGLTEAEYGAMLLEQGGVCAICQRPERSALHGGGARLAVDHYHATGSVRGLLCGSCNRALGAFEDSAALLEKAIDYLRKHERAETKVG